MAGSIESTTEEPEPPARPDKLIDGESTLFAARQPWLTANNVILRPGNVVWLPTTLSRRSTRLSTASQPYLPPGKLGLPQITLSWFPTTLSGR